MTLGRTPRDPGTRTGTVFLGPDRRLRAQIAAIAGVGLLVVLGGLGLGGPPDEATGPDQSATARVGEPTAPPSSSPSPTSATAGPVAACVVPLGGNLPSVRLRSSSEDQSPVPGTAGPAPSGEPAGSPVPEAWTVPGLERGLLLPSGAFLVIDAERSACIVSVAMAVAAADATDPGSVAGVPRVVEPARPTDEVNLGGLPAGDWVVRVEVGFIASDGGGASLIRTAYFRVVSGDMPVLAPSPQVTPAVACAPDPLGSGSPDLVLVVDDGPPVPQQNLKTAQPVDVGLGQRIEVRALGDVCARGWSIEVADGLGNAFLQESYPNPVDNPFLAAQNRWVLTQLLTGESTLTATVGFGRDRQSSGTWRLRLETPALPAAHAEGPDGVGVPALPGCGEYWDLPGGMTAFEPCFVQTVPEGLETLRLEAGGVVRIGVDDWSVTSWFASCGELLSTNGVPAEFVTIDECVLGGRSSPAAIAFVPWPGNRLVNIGITAEREGVTAYGNYYIRVDAAP
jgi:hypothetical protein